MKKLIIAFFILSHSSLSLASYKVKKVADFPNLSKLFEVVSEIASEGASLAFFGYDEKAFKGNVKKCVAVGKSEVENHIDEILDRVRYEEDHDDRIKPHIESARKEWHELVRYHSFRICGRTLKEDHTIGYIDSFVSEKYTITFHFGYED